MNGMKNGCTANQSLISYEYMGRIERIAEIRILVRTLPIEVGRCREGRYLRLKLVIFSVMITFLDSIDLGNSNITRKTRKPRLKNYLKVAFAHPSTAGDIYGMLRSKLLLSAIK